MSPTRPKARHIYSVVRMSLSTSSSANLVRQAALCVFSRSSSAIMRMSAMRTMPSLQQQGGCAPPKQLPLPWPNACGLVQSAAVLLTAPCSDAQPHAAVLRCMQHSCMQTARRYQAWVSSRARLLSTSSLSTISCNYQMRQQLQLQGTSLIC